MFDYVAAVVYIWLCDNLIRSPLVDQIFFFVMSIMLRQSEARWSPLIVNRDLQQYNIISIMCLRKLLADWRALLSLKEIIILAKELDINSYFLLYLKF